ncbi:hypothetical protein [Nocardia jinanensis]|nr:hypothetical protein [Nocardia jinanensis]
MPDDDDLGAVAELLVRLALSLLLNPEGRLDISAPPRFASIPGAIRHGWCGDPAPDQRGGSNPVGARSYRPGPIGSHPPEA